METKQFKCSGDCMKCNPIQRQYCAAQCTYNTMRMVEDLNKALTAMQGNIEDVKKKIESIQGNEATLFDPMGQATLFSETETAQGGDGAESRSPETD